MVSTGGCGGKIQTENGGKIQLTGASFAPPAPVASTAPGGKHSEKLETHEMERPVDGGGGTLYSIRAVQRVCDVLDLIQENPDGFSLTQVAERAAFPKSSAFRYLPSL